MPYTLVDAASEPPTRPPMTDVFNKRSADEFTYHAGDFEATGYTASAEPTSHAITTGNGEVSVIVREHPDHPLDDIDHTHLAQKLAAISDLDVNLTCVETLSEFVEELGKYADTLDDRDILTYYNGDTYRGGFDLPLLRRIAWLTDTDYPYSGLMYTDAKDPIDRGRVPNARAYMKKSLNKPNFVKAAEMFGLDPEGTKAEVRQRVTNELTPEQIEEWAAEHNDGDLPTKNDTTLDYVLSTLGSDTGDYDPFKDGSEAVTAWESGEYTDLLLHNIADVERTAELMDFLVATVPDTELRPKRL